MEHFLKFLQSILTANLVHMAFFNQLDVIKTSSKPHCSLSPGRIFEGPQFPKLRLLRCPKFSPEFFSPSFRLGAACGLAWGLRLPRPNTAALRSWERPRFRGPAAPRGEGGRGCEGRNMFGRGLEGGYWWGNLMRPWDFVVKCMKMLMVHWWFNFLVDIVFTIFWKACQNICTNVWCCCVWTQLYCSYTLGWSLFESRILVWK